MPMTLAIKCRSVVDFLCKRISPRKVSRPGRYLRILGMMLALSDGAYAQVDQRLPWSLVPPGNWKTHCENVDFILHRRSLSSMSLAYFFADCTVRKNEKRYLARLDVPVRSATVNNDYAINVVNGELQLKAPERDASLLRLYGMISNTWMSSCQDPYQVYNDQRNFLGATCRDEHGNSRQQPAIDLNHPPSYGLGSSVAGIDNHFGGLMPFDSGHRSFMPSVGHTALDPDYMTYENGQGWYCENNSGNGPCSITYYLWDKK